MCHKIRTDHSKKRKYEPSSSPIRFLHLLVCNDSFPWFLKNGPKTNEQPMAYSSGLPNTRKLIVSYAPQLKPLLYILFVLVCCLLFVTSLFTSKPEYFFHKPIYCYCYFISVLAFRFRALHAVQVDVLDVHI